MNGIMPICNHCDKQFATETEYAEHLKTVHGITAHKKQMDLSVSDKSVAAQLAAKDSEIASLRAELDAALGGGGVLEAKDAEIAGLNKELAAATEANGNLQAEIDKLKKAAKAH